METSFILPWKDPYPEDSSENNGAEQNCRAQVPVLLPGCITGLGLSDLLSEPNGRPPLCRRG